MGIVAIGCSPLELGKSKKAFQCYDERGAKYVMPLFLFEDPRNLVENKGLEKLGNNNDPEQNKEVNPNSNEMVEFKVRLNIGGDLEVKMREQNTIQELKEYISSQLNNLDPTKIRIIAKGKMLSNSYLIADPFRIKNGDIIHASFPSSLYKAPSEGM